MPIQEEKNRAMKILNGKIFSVVIFEALLFVATSATWLRLMTPSLFRLTRLPPVIPFYYISQKSTSITRHADRFRMRDNKVNGRTIKATKQPEMTKKSFRSGDDDGIVFIARVLM